MQRDKKSSAEWRAAGARQTHTHTHTHGTAENGDIEAKNTVAAYGCSIGAFHVKRLRSSLCRLHCRPIKLCVIYTHTHGAQEKGQRTRIQSPLRSQTKKTHDILLSKKTKATLYERAHHKAGPNEFRKSILYANNQQSNG